jgi:hypothetical protein
MRASDATEKISREQATLLQPYKAALPGLLREATQQEVRWHLAVMIPRLRLTSAECRHAAQLLWSFLEDRSSIVKTFAMQGLWDLTRQDTSVRPMVLDLIRSLTRTGTPAMQGAWPNLAAENGTADILKPLTSAPLESPPPCGLQCFP